MLIEKQVKVGISSTLKKALYPVTDAQRFDEVASLALIGLFEHFFLKQNITFADMI
jgi:uncharacterized protein (DUF486 family)